MSLSDAHFLAVAHIVADAGTCQRLKVGAVLVYARRIISTGYNGTPAGQEHCAHFTDALYDPPCREAVHAEANVIAYAAKHGISSDGTTLYVTDSPCYDCAKLLINAGVKEVKYGRKYRLGEGLDLLEAVGIRVEQLGEPELQLMSVSGRDDEGVYTGKSADPAFDEGWREYSEHHRRGGTGVQRGGDR